MLGFHTELRRAKEGGTLRRLLSRRRLATNCRKTRPKAAPYLQGGGLYGRQGEKVMIDNKKKRGIEPEATIATGGGSRRAVGPEEPVIAFFFDSGAGEPRRPEEEKGGVQGE